MLYNRTTGASLILSEQEEDENCKLLVLSAVDSELHETRQPLMEE